MSRARTLVLADHRSLGYAEYGDPDGFPVLNCHGGLQSRTDVALAQTDALDLSVRIISPDRPGVALSSRRPGHDTAQWVDDVRELTERLGVERFGVMGWSLGGQYALAVAYFLAQRVTAAAVIAGCPPLDDRATFGQMNVGDRLLSRLSVRVPAAAQLAFAATHRLAGPRVVRLVGRLAWGLPASDAAVLRREPEWFAASLVESTSDARGAVDEYRAMIAPWGFRPEDVPVPVRIWQGTSDTLVPARWARVLAARIPGSEVVEVPGGGHLIAVTRRREVLAWLAWQGDPCRRGPDAAS